MHAMLKRLHDERQATWDGSKALLDDVEKRDGKFTAEEQTDWDRRNADLVEIDKKIADLDKAFDGERRADEARSRYEKVAQPDGERRGDRPGGKELRAHQRPEYRDAFDAFLRNGMGGLNPEQRELMQHGYDSEVRAQGTTSGSVGGYLVPQGFYDVLTEAMKFYGGMLDPGDLNPFGDEPEELSQNSAGVTVLHTESGNPLPMPTANDTGNVGAILAENGTITGQDVAFGQMTLGAFTYTSKLILIPWQLGQDSAFNLAGDYLPRAAGERLGRILNTHFTTGDGSSKPTGVATAATVGVTASTGGTTAITYDNMVDLEMSLDPSYRQRGKYMFSDTALGTLRKLKDSQGHPLWQPSLQAGVASLFNGRPYVVNNDIAVPAADAVSVLYGDFSKYIVRLVGQASLVRLEERYADALQTGFFVWVRADGNLLDAGTHPIKAFKQSHT